MENVVNPQVLPVLPLRDVVVYPAMVIPLFVGRDKSMRALDAAMEADKRILLVAQRSPDVDDPGAEELYDIGTVASILQLLKLPDGTIKVLVEGGERATLSKAVEHEGYLVATAEPVSQVSQRNPREVEAAAKSLVSLFEQYVKLNRKIPPELLTTLSGIEDPGRLADHIAAHLAVRLSDKQKVLESADVGARLELLIGLVDGEIDVQQIEKRIRGRVKSQMEKSQREYYLNEQMKAIQKELGEGEEQSNEVEELGKKIASAGMPEGVKMKGPILCLVGPPGVGKTSLGQSIARATHRRFVRMSLGGVRDEAEIRGHRRTYIGSLPGRVIQNLAKAGSKNPLFMLDEIDKMSMDFRGDPSSALLEVLDPEQNHAFSDHYLEVDVDLAEVVFIATANSLNIPPPLLDRMEVIRIPGYTEDEKIHIAKRYLVPKQLKANGLGKDELKVNDDALRDIIRYYSRESGVRNLERELAKICRKVVKEISLKQPRGKDKDKPAGKRRGHGVVNANRLSHYLGVRRYRYGRAEEQNEIGLVTGLAWTEVGGDLLSIEAAVVPGKGKLLHTGQLGDVMQESIHAALSVVRSRSERLGLDPDFQQKLDMHIQVPEGATPKDGPSAGIAMCTALVSALSKVAVRADLAMTGEITLRGRVLPIGGLKEKLLAAQRGGMRTVIIPDENIKDLADIPKNVTEHLEIKPVRWIDEVLDLALVRPLGPNVKPVEPAPTKTETGEVDKPASSEPPAQRPH